MAKQPRVLIASWAGTPRAHEYLQLTLVDLILRKTFPLLGPTVSEFSSDTALFNRGFLNNCFMIGSDILISVNFIVDSSKIRTHLIHLKVEF